MTTIISLSYTHPIMEKIKEVASTNKSLMSSASVCCEHRKEGHW